eukprot:Gregarina_sp_Poly_1__6278@NODE_3330_length_1177_cov_101_269369_g2076_i1_p1_GENE_NODE_3330_length_1177_cov_101_269369_g2076_i1NODE_3330_length_1177_cov_101_269369_g2076_i1_p1_ORF_typecomplete_len267_score38_74Nitroreductase/PF00881_24/8_7e26TM1586_NiRdase/PF14512_6/5_1e08_NODE_3330_length_1177_cov_101_269369_g2076_i12831083
MLKYHFRVHPRIYAGFCQSSFQRYFFRFKMTTLPTNPVVECLLSHSSNRRFKPDPIDDGILQQVLRCGQRAPTSKNSQAVSVIVVTDPEVRRQIAVLANNQPWVAECPVFLVVCADWHKVNMAVEKENGAAAAITDTTEGIVTGSMDTGIVLQAMLIAARSFGLGVVPIGGIRANGTKLSSLLNLPTRVFPMPRMRFETFVHSNEYQRDDAKLEEATLDMDQRVMEYWAKVKRPDGLNWSKTMAQMFKTDYRPKLKDDLKNQGFNF